MCIKFELEMPLPFEVANLRYSVFRITLRIFFLHGIFSFLNFFTLQ